MKKIVLFLAPSVVSYLVFAFILWEANPALWELKHRLGLVTTDVFITGMVALYFHIVEAI